MDKAKKVVVVTGASAGLGRAIVREFAKEGADVALNARGIDGLEGAKKEVEAYGGKALICQLDVADAEAIEKAAEEIETTLGPIDVWVNNAMNSVFSPINEMKAEEYKWVTEVTYLGQVYGALAALKRMQTCNRGSIIFVGSALAYRGIVWPNTPLVVFRFAPGRTASRQEQHKHLQGPTARHEHHPVWFCAKQTSLKTPTDGNHLRARSSGTGHCIRQ